MCTKRYRSHNDEAQRGETVEHEGRKTGHEPTKWCPASTTQELNKQLQKQQKKEAMDEPKGALRQVIQDGEKIFRCLKGPRMFWRITKKQNMTQHSIWLQKQKLITGNNNNNNVIIVVYISYDGITEAWTPKHNNFRKFPAPAVHGLPITDLFCTKCVCVCVCHLLARTPCCKRWKAWCESHK